MRPNRTTPNTRHEFDGLVVERDNLGLPTVYLGDTDSSINDEISQAIAERELSIGSTCTDFPLTHQQVDWLRIISQLMEFEDNVSVSQSPLTLTQIEHA